MIVEPEVSSAGTEDQEETAEAEQKVSSETTEVEVEVETKGDQQKLFELLGTTEPDWEAVIARYAAANLL